MTIRGGLKERGGGKGKVLAEHQALADRSSGKAISSSPGWLVAGRQRAVEPSSR